MDILVVIVIVTSLINAYNESQKAKKKRSMRQGMDQQTVYRSESERKYSDGKRPPKYQGEAYKPEAPHAETYPKKRKKNDFDHPYQPEQADRKNKKVTFKDLLDQAGSWLDIDDGEVVITDSKKKEAKEKQPHRKPDPRTRSPKNSKKKKEKTTMPQTLYKGQQSRKDNVLIERNEREDRNHKKVSASVKPLKNAFDNDEHCEHRIELNPNIKYSNQTKTKENASKVAVQTDKDSLIQGIIWSEILGKPKSMQNKEKMERLIGRNR